MNYRIRKTVKIAVITGSIAVLCLIQLIRLPLGGAKEADISEDLFSMQEESFDEGINQNTETVSIPGSEETEEENSPGTENHWEEESETPSIYVHVSGAVRFPDRVYRFCEGERIEDAVKAAGGLLEQADLTEVNLAGRLVDGMKIYIPRQGERAVVMVNQGNSGGRPGETEGLEGEKEEKSRSESGTNGLTNINTASIMELDSLPGIGPALAQRIIDFREAEGPFQSIEELKLVKGIGDKLFEKLRDRVTTT